MPPPENDNAPVARGVGRSADVEGLQANGSALSDAEREEEVRCQAWGHDLQWGTERTAPRPDPRQWIAAVQVDDFLELKLPPRETLLAPWLREQSINLIAAFRGVGKTHAALRIAYAVASGGAFLRWRAPQPAPVLYIDGEMAATDMQTRLRAIVEAAEPKAEPGAFRIVTPDLCDGPMPDLATEQGQALIAPVIRDAKLIVVDNLSSLARTGIENDAESWQMIADWALAMRRQHRAVLFVHHANKSGQQRGTSKREDLIDCSILLSRPPGYVTSDGARFRLEWTKVRGLHGADAEPFDARMETDADGRVIWTWAPVGDDRTEELRQEGRSIREIAEATGQSKSTVARRLKGGQAYAAASRGD